MLLLIANENFNNDVVRGLLRRKPDLDIIRVQDIGLSGAAVWRMSGKSKFVICHCVSAYLLHL